jgi:hypothetical protein
VSAIQVKGLCQATEGKLVLCGDLSFNLSAVFNESVTERGAIGGHRYHVVAVIQT